VALPLVALLSPLGAGLLLAFLAVVAGQASGDPEPGTLI